MKCPKCGSERLNITGLYYKCLDCGHLDDSTFDMIMSVSEKAKRWIDIIAGHGQIGTALGEILAPSSSRLLFVDPAKKERIRFKDMENKLPDEYTILHICFPYSSHFIPQVLKYSLALEPDLIIIHSTVEPGTTTYIYEMTAERIGLCYSPIRGQHNELVRDLRRYTKFLDGDIPEAEQRFKDAGLKTRSVADDYSLEWTKHISNTFYYHYILAYRQMVHQWCQELNIDEEAVWEFTKELHEYTGVQYPSFFDKAGIGGHCVLQNSKLISRSTKAPKTMRKLARQMLKLNEEVKAFP